MFDFVNKAVSFFLNGNLIVTQSPDGLKNSPHNANITKVTIMKDMKAIVSDVNLITTKATQEKMKYFTLCESLEVTETASWGSGLWKIVEANS